MRYQAAAFYWCPTNTFHWGFLWDWWDGGNSWTCTRVWKGRVGVFVWIIAGSF